jgi:hypothetical protein
MAGLLDKNTRVVDMILTGEGRRLLSKNKLRFSYFALFDDEVDYDPYIFESGSLNDDNLSLTRRNQVEESIVSEAVCGYRLNNFDGFDFTNVHYPMFTIPHGKMFLPRMTASDNHNDSGNIEIKQHKVQELSTKLDDFGNVVEQIGPNDLGFERFDSSTFSISAHLKPESIANDLVERSGYLLRVFKETDEGFVEIKDKRDRENRVCYMNDLVLIVDKNEE